MPAPRFLPAATALPRRPLLGGAAALLALGLAACSSAPRSRPSAQRGGTRSSGPVAHSTPPAGGWLALNPAGREASVAQALLLVNTPYRYGGNTPEGGFDCSGLVQYVYRQVAASGQRLPRSTAQWAQAAQPVAESQLQRGDLVFFNTLGRPFSHMGIYVGEGQFVHAPSSGGTVRKDTVGSRYFGPRYQGARSVFAA